MPLVSICIPTYNQPEQFERALNSVFTQEFDDYEIIITDDSDNDEIHTYLKKNLFLEKVRYFRNKPALGSPQNWNLALSFAQGKYIKILHHDDWFSSESALGKFVAILERHAEINFAFSSSINTHAHTNISTKHSPSRKNLKDLFFNPAILLCGNFIGAPSVSFYRAMPSGNFDVNLKWLVDIDFYIRNWRGDQFYFIEEPLVNISIGGSEQATNVYQASLKVNIFEYLSVFNNISSFLDVASRKKSIQFLKRILSNFNVRDIEQIQACGYFGPVPQELVRFLKVIRFNQKLAQCLARL